MIVPEKTSQGAGFLLCHSHPHLVDLPHRDLCAERHHNEFVSKLHHCARVLRSPANNQVHASYPSGRCSLACHKSQGCTAATAQTSTILNTSCLCERRPERKTISLLLLGMQRMPNLSDLPCPLPAKHSTAFVLNFVQSSLPPCKVPLFLLPSHLGSLRLQRHDALNYYSH